MHASWRFPSSDAFEARRVRVAIVDYLAERCDGDLAASEVVLGELFSNAHRHGCDGSVDADVELDVRVTIHVSSPGQAFVLPAAFPSNRAVGGRGLMLVRRLAGEPTVTVRGGICTVSVGLPLRPKSG